MKQKLLYIFILIIIFIGLFSINVQASNNKQDIFRTVTDTAQEDGSHRIDYRIYNTSRKKGRDCNNSI